jgi:uncharacterized RDD family membrane protein YckC
VTDDDRPPPPPFPDPFGGDGVVEQLPASVVRRFAARLIDGCIVLAITFPIWLSWIDTEALSDADAEVATPSLAALAALLVINGVYEVVPLVLWGRTPGKRLLGLVVEAVGGGYLAWHQATIRYLLPNAVSLLPAPVGLFGVTAVYGSALANSLRRGWHDRAAGSIVVGG